MKFVKNMFGWKSKSKRKGITPVIAIVLLLMMTVAAAGMAYVWIMSLQESVQNQGNEGVEKQQRETSAAITIVSAWNDSTHLAFIVKNSGTYTFSSDELDQFTYYFNGVYNDATGFGTPCTGLDEPGSICKVVSDEDFPDTAGTAGQVVIKVDPPFGSTSPYSCATKTAADDTC
ncbi:MAG: hypothetical protein DRN71_04805 [Candidatus Nanohalarchaeota archaeon]|nr:MAG: hypothetical protein DRN71_04805 [Candidatus Nanohaloarchaeota archaeon]